MKYYIPIILFTLFSCKTNNETEIVLDFKVFKVTAPKGWIKINQQGIDSYVGGLSNGQDTLWFDYGQYSVNLHQQYDLHKLAIDTVNGLIAEIVIPNDSHVGTLSMYIPRINNQFKLTIYCTKVQDANIILKIFKSIIFKESDPLKNPALTLEKFSKKLSQSGENLFKSNCANCHRTNFDYTGPALSDRFRIRTKDWLYTFLTNRNQIKNDSTRKELKAKFEFSCQEFPSLSQQDTDAIYLYCN